MPSPFPLLKFADPGQALPPPGQPQTTDAHFMRQALHLAAKGWGRTSPNPVVGCVIVRNGRIVGSGWHRQAGSDHAEVAALADAGERARGATAYVTLEPCTHYGRTPPCTAALIKAGISRVVIPHRDPNPLVAGRGVARLKAAGIEVKEGVLAQEAAHLNEIFIHWMETKQPFVWWKTAMSMDGKIATAQGDSRWITGPQSRQAVHWLRDRLDAVMVGVGTVLADDPRLNSRLEDGGRDPAVVIADGWARTPPSARLFSTRRNNVVYVAVSPAAPEERVAALQAAGAKILTVPFWEDEIDPLTATDGALARRLHLPTLLQKLAEYEHTSVLLEGGSRLAASFLQARLVNKAWLFMAPKIIGGQKAIGPVGDPGVDKMARALTWRFTQVTRRGEDILVEAYP